MVNAAILQRETSGAERQKLSDPDILFFFSSRRRHTRCGRDWSSDVCSSDLHPSQSQPNILLKQKTRTLLRPERSEERRVGKSVDLGGRRIIKKKKKKTKKSSKLRLKNRYKRYNNKHITS